MGHGSQTQKVFASHCQRPHPASVIENPNLCRARKAAERPRTGTCDVMFIDWEPSNGAEESAPSIRCRWTATSNVKAAVHQLPTWSTWITNPEGFRASLAFNIIRHHGSVTDRSLKTVGEIIPEMFGGLVKLVSKYIYRDCFVFQHICWKKRWRVLLKGGMCQQPPFVSTLPGRARRSARSIAVRTMAVERVRQVGLSS
jgi:hypothetical protein